MDQRRGERKREVWVIGCQIVRSGINLIVISKGTMKRNDEPVGNRKKLEDYSYVLGQPIGRGYSSQVFRGRNDVTDEPVAIKVIDMKLIKGEVHRNLLASEIEVLRTLKNSAHVIQMKDVYNTKNNTYIITELCEGGDLAKALTARRCYTETEAVAFMKLILKGYLQIQAHSIIHRDLKPANIFLSDGQPKIADFGFAMRATDAKKYASYNVGSPVYMPPEALNDNKYSFKSDVWALGVIFYELLTGKTPWRAKTEKDLAKQLQSIPIRKLMPPSISSSSQAFLMGTLALDISQRIAPQALHRFSFSSDKSSIMKPLYSTEQSLFDTRNNNIRKAEGSSIKMEKVERHDTSLNRGTNTPSHKKGPLAQTNSEFKSGGTNDKLNFSMPKTAATISHKTEHFIQEGTQKELISETTIPDRKIVSKQLLSQVHMCRFLYKLIIRMREKLQDNLNDQLIPLQHMMAALIFDKLHEVKQLKLLNQKTVVDYKASSDYQKILQIVDQYLVKYNRDLGQQTCSSKGLPLLKDQLTSSILVVYHRVDEANMDCEEVIVLDYLVTLRQLVNLLQSNDLQGFHLKSKIEAIVEGTPSKKITNEHLAAIRSKLKAVNIL